MTSEKLWVGYALDSCFPSSPGHSNAVTQLAIHNNTLYSASRDSTIKAWDIGIEGRPTLQQTLYAHTDWVNCVTFVNDKSTLLSASVDNTIALWSVTPEKDTTTWLKSFSMHRDSITSLCYSSENAKILSASLDGRIKMWNLEHGLADTFEDFGRDVEMIKTEQSIYSLACQMSLIAIGSSSRSIDIFDIKSKEALFSLKGHSENIKCLKFLPDAAALISGSSDGTVKIWDIRSRKCAVTVCMPDNSAVWSLDLAGNATLFAGLKNGVVQSVNVTNGEVVTLYEHKNGPIMNIKYHGDMQQLWLGTSLGEILALREERHFEDEFFDIDRIFEESTIVLPLECKVPVSLVEAKPKVIDKNVAANKIELFLKYSDNSLRLLNILTGECKIIEAGENESLDKIVECYQQKIWSCPWFHLRTNLGFPVLWLEKSTIFNAELYPKDLGFEINSDSRINLGKSVLEMLFADWKEEYSEELGNDQKPIDRLQLASPNSSHSIFLKGNSLQLEPISNTRVLIVRRASDEHITDSMIYFPQSRSEEDRNTIFSKLNRILSDWLAQALIRNVYNPSPDIPKIQFSIMPREGCPIPIVNDLLKLSGNPSTRMAKIALYAQGKIKAAMKGNINATTSVDDIMLWFGDELLDDDLALGTLKHFKHRKGSPVILHFGYGK